MVYSSDDPYLTIQEAADYLNISISSMRRLFTGTTKEIAVTKIGRLVRIKKSELDRYLASKTS